MKLLKGFLLCAASSLIINCSPLINAQTAIGDWTVYASLKSTDYCVAAGRQVYVLASGALYIYDTEDESITLINRVSGLSEALIAFIRYVPTAQCLVIVYRSGNVDLLYSNGNVVNLKDYKDKNLSYDKTVNNVSIIETKAYMCTNFGVVGIDTKRALFGDTYVLGKKVYAVEKAGRYIYAATDGGVYRGEEAANLLDVSNWAQLSAGIYTDLKAWQGFLYLCGRGYGVRAMNISSGAVSVMSTGNYNKFSSSAEHLVATDGWSWMVFTSPSSYKTVNAAVSVGAIHPFGAKFVAAVPSKGLMFYDYDWENGVLTESLFVPPPAASPIRNLAASMTMTADRLLVAGGGIYVDRYYNAGSIMQYKDGRWTAFQEQGIEAATGLAYRDITGVVVFPKDTSVVYASSGGEGVYKFVGGQFQTLYSLGNSTLRSALNNSPRYVRTGGMTYDSKGNLYVMNMLVDSVVNILTPDGTWLRPYYGELRGWSPIVSLIDSRGNLWVTSQIHPGGVACIQFGYSMETSADDRILARTQFINQDGTTVGGAEEPRVFSIAEDRDGTIWIGTMKGLLSIPNPTQWYNESFRFMQPKIPRNDGTGLADYLLAGERINAIAVDGGNRKWFGTSETGLYLIDSDNQTQLYHFTTENSPLPSNNVQSIAINQQTGEVFIGTTAGIVSYHSSITEGMPTFASEVHAYPNPVRRDYTGPITIKGLMYDTSVKITDTAGRLVCEGRSVGGTYIWDGCNGEGQRVSAGIYFVLAAEQSGKESVATKVMIIR